MAVFRIDKTRDYTVMANHHLRNKALSLKAKGLLSLMLSLPEDWDYTTKGLSMICKDGVDSICSTVKELEKAGYLYTVPGKGCYAEKNTQLVREGYLTQIEEHMTAILTLAAGCGLSVDDLTEMLRLLAGQDQ